MYKYKIIYSISEISKKLYNIVSYFFRTFISSEPDSRASRVPLRDVAAPALIATPLTIAPATANGCSIVGNIGARM